MYKKLVDWHDIQQDGTEVLLTIIDELIDLAAILDAMSLTVLAQLEHLKEVQGEIALVTMTLKAVAPRQPVHQTVILDSKYSTLHRPVCPSGGVGVDCVADATAVLSRIELTVSFVGTLTRPRPVEPLFTIPSHLYKILRDRTDMFPFQGAADSCVFYGPAAVEQMEQFHDKYKVYYAFMIASLSAYVRSVGCLPQHTFSSILFAANYVNRATRRPRQ